MALLAASIPTLRPLIRAADPTRSRTDKQSGSYAFRNLKQAISKSYPTRGKDGRFLVLSDSPQAWASEERLNVIVGQGSVSNTDDISDGINKTTTVTVSG
jgi:hypothetical protein